ncbi:methylated-DNA--protein-cysteine methyltransferase [Thalassobacillus devorans]|uniref:Methylated-DNA--protein-cysteine methyltransferase n=1 Tax=Thalassobacillus devorans TaxID=279813 RepID=A0ABQ1PTK6_9BACI|nr:methylated-DNA--[protein]-cysteine S-methyltransferase [Thalassobacillus devorans]NIK30690.1 O-6-methylguanine DNA methyltransferase [Thalassobacillus devorans]GGD03015.1 methylated-DNA--protein-cysteine methyltransferase [Thalassobacillus devorans]
MTKRSFLYYDELETPLGTMTLVADKDGVCRIDYGSYQELATHHNNWARQYYLCPKFVQDGELLEAAIKEFQEYFQGTRHHFSFDHQMYGTPFQQKVWKALSTEIPYGETRSYKDIAKAIQAPKAIRAVGGAINRNPLSISIPCHRVIGSNGKLVGYNGGLEKKRKLLELEMPQMLFNF